MIGSIAAIEYHYTQFLKGRSSHRISEQIRFWERTGRKFSELRMVIVGLRLSLSSILSTMISSSMESSSSPSSISRRNLLTRILCTIFLTSSLEPSYLKRLSRFMPLIMSLSSSSDSTISGRLSMKSSISCSLNLFSRALDRVISICERWEIAASVRRRDSYLSSHSS